MRNYVKHILVIAVAVVIALFAGCAQEGDELIFGDGAQTVFTITGIDAQYNGQFASGGMASAQNSPNQDMAIVIPEKIVNGTVNLRMWSANSITNSNTVLPKPASLSGAGVLMLLISANQNMNNTTYEGYYITGVSPGFNDPPIIFGVITKTKPIP